jgi:hypothetical protein
LGIVPGNEVDFELVPGGRVVLFKGRRKTTEKPVRSVPRDG